MLWIYLSPHLDDVALSCGGLVWEQVQKGDTVSIWTICAGDIPTGPLSPFAQSLHARWQASELLFRGDQAPHQRRQEDLISCARLGASARHFSLPDCIYRRRGTPVGRVSRPDSQVSIPDNRSSIPDGAQPDIPADSPGEFLYASEESLFGSLHPAEAPLVQALSLELAAHLPVQAELVSPLTIGGHVDHRLTRAAAERLERPLWYYADYPYTASSAEQLQALRQAGWYEMIQPVSDPGLHTWADSVAAHASQISTFWSNLEQMQRALNAYSQQQGGICLWRAS